MCYKYCYICYKKKQLLKHNLSTSKVSFVDMTDTPDGTMQLNVHRGEVVRAYVDKSGKSITEIAERIGRSRVSLYRDFDDAEMDWNYIMKIGAVIEHDFSKDFPELSLYKEQFIREEITAFDPKDQLLNRALKEIDQWKTKAYENLSEAVKWKDKAYDNLAESNKWKEAYYKLSLETGKSLNM